MAKDQKPPPSKGESPAIKSKPKDDAEARKSLADALVTPERLMEWFKGDITYWQLAGVTPTELAEMAMMGYSMYEQGRLKEAKAIFDGLCSFDHKESYYRTALGAVYLAEEDLEMAEQLFNRAIEMNDKDIAAYVNRGEVHLRKSDVLEAAQDFKKAIMLDPEAKNPVTQRARVLAAAVLQTIQAAQEAERAKGGKPEAGKTPATGTPKAAAKPAKVAGKKK
jgi:tetratricopeptide (TPR) repeat protein